MEIKKNPKIDVNRRKGLFFNIGLILSLVLVLSAFEWKFYGDMKVMDLGELEEEAIVMEEIPIIDLPPPPPPVLQQPEIIEVNDDVEVDKQIEIELDVEPKEVVVVTPPIKIDVPPPVPPVEEPEETIFLIVEEQPTPDGGFEKFYKQIMKEVKYPKMARRMDVQGKVITEFVVDTDGSLTNIKVLKGIGAGCDEEAVRVLKKAPKWKPGKQRGRAVKVRMSIPVLFRLR